MFTYVNVHNRRTFGQIQTAPRNCIAVINLCLSKRIINDNRFVLRFAAPPEGSDNI